MAFLHRRAPEASTSDTPDTSPGRTDASGLARLPASLRPSRAALALLIAALLLAVSALPAGAAWPVGTRHSYRSQGFHPGHRANDIAADRGARVVPVRSGTVVFAGWKSNCGGRQVYISHGNGLYSAYYHLSRETTARGRRVRGQETTIGRVGTSGCVTGAHLHVEMWRGYPWRPNSHRVRPGRYINSGTFLPARYR